MAKQKELELAIKIAGKMDKSLTATLTGARNQISSFSRSLGALGGRPCGHVLAGGGERGGHRKLHQGSGEV